MDLPDVIYLQFYEGDQINATDVEYIHTKLIRAFCERFDIWIMKQSGDVQLATAMAFGEEYKVMRDSLEPGERECQYLTKHKLKQMK